MCMELPQSGEWRPIKSAAGMRERFFSHPSLKEHPSALRRWVLFVSSPSPPYGRPPEPRRWTGGPPVVGFKRMTGVSHTATPAPNMCHFYSTNKNFYRYIALTSIRDFGILMLRDNAFLYSKTKQKAAFWQRMKRRGVQWAE